MNLAERTSGLLAEFGLEAAALGGSGEPWAVHSPVDGSRVAQVRAHTPAEADGLLAAAEAAFEQWRVTPGPVRGRLVKRLGELIGEHKQHLADLVTIEVGKIGSEALGEVQEMIDICDLAVGLSRQLFGRTMPSERPGHRLQEVWHPLGVVGVISSGRGTPPSRLSAVTPWCGSPPAPPR